MSAALSSFFFKLIVDILFCLWLDLPLLGLLRCRVYYYSYQCLLPISHLPFLKERYLSCPDSSRSEEGRRYGGPQLSRQNLFRHGKIILATAKSFWPRQNPFRHGKILFNRGKIILATAKSFSSRQNHFNHGKIIFVTAKSF